MKKKCESLYKTSRENAGLTQEEAVERLGLYFEARGMARTVSEKSLSDYENKRTRVSNEVAKAMSVVYGCPLLRYLHIAGDPDMDGVLPDVRMPVCIKDAALQLWSARDALMQEVEPLMRIACQQDADCENLDALDAITQTIKQKAAAAVTATVMFLEKYAAERRREFERI